MLQCIASEAAVIATGESPIVGFLVMIGWAASMIN
jgi:hypothetical protein